MFFLQFIIIIIIIIKNLFPFFTYLRAELNSQWPVTESARIKTPAAVRQDKDKKSIS
jgi:hypothetical protein